MRGSNLGRAVVSMAVVKIIRVHGVTAVSAVSSRVAMIENNAQIAKILEIFKPERVLTVSA